MENLNDTNTRLLLHFEGTPGTTTLVDSAVGGSSAKTIVNAGVISAAQAKFGATSLRCYGVDNNCRIDPHIDWGFGASVWTADGWFYANASPYLFCWWLDANNYCGLALVRVTGSAAVYRIVLRVGGVNVAVSNDVGIPLIGQWQHVALERRANGKLWAWSNGDYLDGVNLPSAAYAINMQNWPLYVGSAPLHGVPGRRHLDGWVDEFRVHNAELLDVGGVVAGLEYDLPTVQYPSVRTKHGRGAHAVRRTIVRHARGIYAVGLLPVTRLGRGIHHVRRSVVTHGRGVYAVRMAVVKHGRGTHSVGLTSSGPLVTHFKIGRGRHTVRRTAVKHSRGVHYVGLIPVAKTTRGIHHVRHAIVKIGRGIHTVMRLVTKRGRGIHDVNSGPDTYELYYGNGVLPDLTAPPAKTSPTLPFDSDAITGAGLHYFIVRQRSAAGVLSRNTEPTVIELDAGDIELAAAPSVPIEITVAADVDGGYRVSAIYLYTMDAAPGDTWLIFATDDGVDPDPDVDTPSTSAIVTGDGVGKLVYASGAGAAGRTIKVMVGVRQTDGRDAVDTNIVTCTTSVTGPAAPVVEVVKTVRGKGVKVMAV